MVIGHGSVRQVRLYLENGSIACRYYETVGARSAVLWLGGVGGGFDSPAHDLFDRMASDFLGRRVNSVRLRYRYASDLDLAKQEIEMGFSAVHQAADAPIAPFFRFPDLQHPPALLAYLGERNIATFSTDIDSFDFRLHKPEQVIQSVMSKLEKRGKGIILMHDFQRATAEALPELLRQLKAGGYKVVHLVPNKPVTTLAKYDAMVKQQDKLSSNNTRPENSVVHTIGRYMGSPPPASAAHE